MRRRFDVVSREPDVENLGRERLSMELTAVTPQELVGAMFTTPKELRHIAEQQFGELFVPTEVVAESARSAVISIRPEATGPLLVHAERERHWYPFRVTRVEPEDENVRPRP